MIDNKRRPKTMVHLRHLALLLTDTNRFSLNAYRTLHFTPSARNNNPSNKDVTVSGEEPQNSDNILWPFSRDVYRFISSVKKTKFRLLKWKA